jgi:hypothetical protein
MTAYPSYDPTNGTSLLANILSVAPSGTATILGAVAVGVVGLGAVAFAINYLRKGGSISGLIGIAKANQGKLQGLVKDLPISDEMKEKLANPEKALPPDAQKALAIATAAAANPQTLVDHLPVSESIKSQINTFVPTTTEGLINAVQHPEELKAQIQAHVQEQVQAQIQAQVQAALGQIQIEIPKIVQEQKE